MSRTFKSKMNKGYILIYILLTGLICMLLVVLGYKMEFDRQKNENSTLNYSMKQSYESKCREYLFSGLYNYLTVNNVNLSSEEINNYLSINSGNFRLTFEGSTLTYDSSLKLLIAAYPFDTYYKKYEYFSINVVSGKLKPVIENSKVI